VAIAPRAARGPCAAAPDRDRAAGQMEGLARSILMMPQAG
jgi:hypothetical protein